MYFKRSFIQHLLYVFRAFNTLDLLNQLNLHKYKNEALQSLSVNTFS